MNDQRTGSPIEPTNLYPVSAASDTSMKLPHWLSPQWIPQGTPSLVEKMGGMSEEGKESLREGHKARFDPLLQKIVRGDFSDEEYSEK